MDSNLPLQHTNTYTLTAAGCNAQSELAPAQLVQHVIETATDHADRLGLGYDRLARDGSLWVLSRVAMEMTRYPRLGERYSLTTWVENYNRHFAERNFEIRLDSTAEVLGYVRTIWVGIDMHTRRPANLAKVAGLFDTTLDRPCPMTKQGKIRVSTTPQACHSYTFRVSDIDCNRHVNSARYVELVLNQLDMSSYDTFYLHRFEIEYRHEAHYGDHVEVCSTFMESDDSLVTAIMHRDKEVCVARAFMQPRHTSIATQAILTLATS